MKCQACEKNFPISRWRTINLEPTSKRPLASTPVNYYTRPGVSQYGNIFACPYCGTLKIKTPIDRS